MNIVLLLDQLRLLPGHKAIVRVGTDFLHLRHHTNDSWIIIEVLYKEIYKGMPFDKPIIDIGAHIGTFLVWVRRYHASIPVICVEPEKENHKILIENIDENNIFFVECVQKALAVEGVDEIVLRGEEEKGAEWSEYGDGGERRSVATVSLSELTRGLEECTLKIDAEGAENVLLGGVPDCVSYVVMEYHMKYCDIFVLRGFLEDLGFVVVLHKSSGESGIMHFSRR